MTQTIINYLYILQSLLLCFVAIYLFKASKYNFKNSFGVVNDTVLRYAISLRAVTSICMIDKFRKVGADTIEVLHVLSIVVIIGWLIVSWKKINYEIRLGLKNRAN